MASYFGFVDTFDGPSLDARWTIVVNTAIVGGRARVLMDNAYGNSIETGTIYDQTGATVVVEVVPDASGDTRDFWAMSLRGGPKIGFEVAEPTLGYYDNGAWTAGPVYNATTHRWWKWTEASGSIIYETSPDGVAWTTIATAVSPGSLTSRSLFMGAGRNTTTGGPFYVYFDNVNNPPPQPVSKAQDIGAATPKATAQTTTAVTFTGATKPAAGDLVYVHCCRDNNTSDALSDTCTDSNGNTYTRVPATPVLSPAGASAAAGCVTVAFYSILTTGWSAGTNTVTWTHPSLTSGGARAMRVEHFQPGAGYVISDVGSSSGISAGGTPTATTSVGTGDLVIGTVGYEQTTAVTGDSDTTNGSWSTAVKSTTAGTTAAAISVANQYKIVTATGSQTFNPTVAGDSAAIVAGFHVAVAGVVYTETPADTASGGDLEADAASFVGALLDTITGTDGTAGAFTAAEFPTDTVAATDTPGDVFVPGGTAYNELLLDGITSSDSAGDAAFYAETPLDTATSTDNAATSTSLVETLADSATGSDTSTESVSGVSAGALLLENGLDALLAEDGTRLAVESSATAYTDTVVDTATGSDTVVDAANQTAAAADTAASADTPGDALTAAGTPADTAASIDTPGEASLLAETVADTASSSDTETEAGVYAATPSDTATSTDGGADGIAYAADNPTDAATSTDATGDAPIYAEVLVDAGTAADIVGDTAALAEAAADSAASVDAVSDNQSSTGSDNPTDAATATDTVADAQLAGEVTSDTAVSSDLAGDTPLYTETPADTAATGDATVGTYVAADTPADTASTTSATDTAAALVEQPADTALVVDSETDNTSSAGTDNLLDTANTADTVADTATLTASTPDAATSTSAGADAATYIAALLDTATSASVETDVVNTSGSETLLDTATTTDTVTDGAAATYTLADTATATDVEAAVLAAAEAIIDAALADDLAAHILAAVDTLLDAADSSDAVSALVEGLVKLRLIAAAALTAWDAAPLLAATTAGRPIT